MFMDAIEEVLKGNKTDDEVSRQFGVSINLVKEVLDKQRKSKQRVGIFDLTECLAENPAKKVTVK